MIINIVGIIIIAITVVIFAIFKTSEYLSTKPKTNKFRQWWSDNIVDLDNRFYE